MNPIYETGLANVIRLTTKNVWIFISEKWWTYIQDPQIKTGQPSQPCEGCLSQIIKVQEKDWLLCGLIFRADIYYFEFWSFVKIILFTQFAS